MSLPVTFAVNGRYLTQPVTGVQRYAANVVSAMNAALACAGSQAPIIAPRTAIDPNLQAMPFVDGGPLGGHAWEQLVLPVRWGGRLLNLCNTAPAVKADQVVCIHDANVFTAPESYRSLFSASYRALQPVLAKRAARIATVSNYSARQIAHYLPVPASAIMVLPNGHEHALAWDPALADIATSVSCERRFVLVLGSRARHKNLELISSIAPELAAMGLSIVIAGGGADVFAPEDLKARDSFTLLGYVTDHDLAYLMERAICLLFPSWTEGFGLPAIEAMARGCPVVSSNRASLPEVCGEAALLAPPDDPAAWVGKVRLLAGSPALRDELIGRGLERVRRFSWPDTAAGYLELMSEPRASRAVRDVKSGPLPRIAVVIATRGRGELVSTTVRHLLKTQTLKPTIVIVSAVAQEDAGDSAALAGVKVVTGPAGLPSQRNTALAMLDDTYDVVVFFDDDFVASPDWLLAAARTFRDEPDVVALTGYLLADGINGPGLTFDEALEILARREAPKDFTRLEPYSPYGCNMAFRRAAIDGLRFDERLVLYGWQEDRDFGATVAQRGGRLVKCASACGVHLGIKGGRVAGERLGYSQVVNPIYLRGKRTMTTAQVVSHILGNVASNLARSIRPEPFVDRRGRLRGNLLGFVDVLRGRVQPERASTILLDVRHTTRAAVPRFGPPEPDADDAGLR